MGRSLPVFSGMQISHLCCALLTFIYRVCAKELLVLGRRGAEMGAHEMLWLCTLIAIITDIKCTNPAGKQFITTFIQNGVTSGSNQRCELRINGLHDQTSVNIVVLEGVYNATFKVDQGKTVTVRLPASVEQRGNGPRHSCSFIPWKS
ncbi:uncharacterized protein PAF06_016598 [Gastrophryne carolinensis]